MNKNFYFKDYIYQIEKSLKMYFLSHKKLRHRMNIILNKLMEKLSFFEFML